jgi:hypothetical protein
MGRIGYLHHVLPEDNMGGPTTDLYPETYGNTLLLISLLAYLACANLQVCAILTIPARARADCTVQMPCTLRDLSRRQTPPIFRTAFIETLSDLFIRSAD